MQPRNGGMILSVDNIGIGVTNLGRSVEFYQHLGFAKAFENERGCTMVAGPPNCSSLWGRLVVNPLPARPLS